MGSPTGRVRSTPRRVAIQSVRGSWPGDHAATDRSSSRHGAHARVRWSKGGPTDKDARDARLRELYRKLTNTSLIVLDATDDPAPRQPQSDAPRPRLTDEERARKMAEAYERVRLRQD